MRKNRHFTKDKHSINVLFWLHQTAKGRDYTINCRMTYLSVRQEFSTRISVKNKEDFDKDKLFIRNNEVGTDLLRNLKFEIERTFADFRITKRDIDLSEIKNRVLGIELKEVHTFFALMAKFENFIIEECDTNYLHPKTKQRYLHWGVLIREFFKERYGVNGSIKKIVAADAKHFEHYAKSTRKYTQNYYVKVFHYFKRALQFAEDSEFISRNPFKLTKVKSEIKRGEWLTQEEVKRIEDTVILHPSLNYIKDCFLFQCYSGLSWKDCHSLRPEHIKELTNGDKYIFKERDKTKQDMTVYLIPKALAILEKYKDNEFCKERGLMLPVIVNERYNIYLKQLADICQVNKSISSHFGRRTFAQWLFDEGVEVKATTSAMGHASIRMTEKHYARIRPESVVKELKAKLG